MSIRIMKKGQVLALTIFMIIVLLGTSAILLIPIQQQLIRVRKLLYSFQALTYAETGLEEGNYKLLKEDIPASSEEPYSGSLCEQKINMYKNEQKINMYKSVIGDWNPSGDCHKITIEEQNYSAEIYSVEMIKEFNYSSFVSNISMGQYKGIDRVLDFDFLP